MKKSVFGGLVLAATVLVVFLYSCANPINFTSTQLLAQKDKYDAYNNTHGGALFF
jgi:hypothetical protein